jgi:hypothetical protein
METTAATVDALVICLASKQKTRCLPTAANLRACPNVRSVEIAEAVTPATMPPVEDVVHPFAFATTVGTRPRHITIQMNDIKQVACALSHVAAWRTCLRRNRPLLIAEDDVTDPAICKRLAALAQAPAEADVVCYETILGRTHLLPPDPADGLGPASPFRRTTNLIGLQCYLITPRGARILLKHALPVVMHVDEYVGYCIESQGLQVFAHRDAPQPYSLSSTIGHNIALEHYHTGGLGMVSAALVLAVIVIVILCVRISTRA